MYGGDNPIFVENTVSNFYYKYNVTVCQYKYKQENCKIDRLYALTDSCVCAILSAEI